MCVTMKRYVKGKTQQTRIVERGHENHLSPCVLPFSCSSYHKLLRRPVYICIFLDNNSTLVSGPTASVLFHGDLPKVRCTSSASRRLWIHRVLARLCAVHRTGPFSRASVSSAPRRAGTALQDGSDSDVIYYLNRTRLRFISTES